MWIWILHGAAPFQDSVWFQGSVSSRPYTVRLGVPVTQLIAGVKVNRQRWDHRPAGQIPGHPRGLNDSSTLRLD